MERPYLPTGTLVIDEGPGAKLRDGEETRAGDKLLGLLRGAPARDVRGQRKAREIIAGQETFAGEIAIAVKIRLHGWKERTRPMRRI